MRDARHRRGAMPDRAWTNAHPPILGAMDWLDLVQWPAMVVTVWAAWLVASSLKRRRQLGFWIFLLSNVLWVVWGMLHARLGAGVPAGLPGGDEHPRRQEGRACRLSATAKRARREIAHATGLADSVGEASSDTQATRDVRESTSRHASRSPHRSARQPCAERRAAREGLRGRRLRGRGGRRVRPGRTCSTASAACSGCAAGPPAKSGSIRPARARPGSAPS